MNAFTLIAWITAPWLMIILWLIDEDGFFEDEKPEIVSPSPNFDKINNGATE